jgi:hypothetical protein
MPLCNPVETPLERPNAVFLGMKDSGLTSVTARFLGVCMTMHGTNNRKIVAKSLKTGIY